MCSLYAEQLHQPRAHQVIWIVDRDAFGARSRPTDDGDRAGAHPERGGERTAYGLIGPAVHGGRGHRDHEASPPKRPPTRVREAPGRTRTTNCIGLIVAAYAGP